MLERKRLDNNPIVYYSNGNKNADWILFIHAAFLDHSIYKRQFNHFQDHYNILAIDLLGHGASKPQSRHDHFMQTPDWINAILEHENIEKVHLVGISLGAVVAQLFADQFPKKVQSLACFGAQNIHNFNPKGHGKMIFSNLILGLKGLISIKWFAKASKNLAAISPEGQVAYVEVARLQSRKPFLMFLQASKPLPKAPDRPRDYPLLIGRGEHDALMPASAIESWQQDEPFTQSITFSNAGHLANLDAPERFNQVLEDFWSKSKGES